jgi:methionine synthase II (cobalamin-independent)
VDSSIVSAVKREHPDLTAGMHICRGNYRSSWMAQGGYEPVAERLFNEVPVDRFLLEYDTERAGGFEPLRFVPSGPTVVLGLVTTKVPAASPPAPSATSSRSTTNAASSISSSRWLARCGDDPAGAPA